MTNQSNDISQMGADQLMQLQLRLLEDIAETRSRGPGGKAAIFQIEKRLGAAKQALKILRARQPAPVKKVPVATPQIDDDVRRLWQAALALAPVMVKAEHKNHTASVVAMFDVAEIMVEELDKRCGEPSHG